MEDNQVLKLSHDDWGQFFLRGLNTMRRTEHMCDAKIMLKDDVKLVAHSCVLAAASPLFKTMLENTDYPEIDMAEFPPELIIQVLEFIYTGEILVSKSEVETLQVVAEALNIPVLAEITRSVGSSFEKNRKDSLQLAEVDESSDIEPQTSIEWGQGKPKKIKTEDVPDLLIPEHSFAASPLSRHVKKEQLPDTEDDDDHEQNLMIGEDPVAEPYQFRQDTILSGDASTILSGLVNLDTTPVVITPKFKLLRGQSQHQPIDIIEQDGVRRLKRRKEWKSLRNPIKIEDVKVIGDGSIPNRAEQTLPLTLTLGTSSTDENIHGVFVIEKLPKGATFGPYEGSIKENPGEYEQSGYCWMIFRNCKLLHWLDGEDESVANWMRFVRHAESRHQQNIEAFQHDGDLFFRALREIPPQQELLVRYGNQYSAKLTKQPMSRDEVQISVKESTIEGFKCLECDKLYTLDTVYWKHMRSVHGEPIPVDIYHKIQADRDRNNQNKIDIKQTLSKDFEKENVNEEDFKLDPESEPRKSSRIATKKASSPRNKKRRGRPRKNAVDDEDNVNNECQICHRTFKTAAVLRQHSAIHTSDKPFKCAICNKGYTQRGNLAMHMMMHTGERPYVCTECGKDFNRRGELKKHMIRHQGHRPFKCITCGKGFGDWGNLHRHKMTHTGEKPFKCHICGRGFSQTSNLRTHIKRHTGEKPYKCPMCTKCFADFCHLQTHLRRHTGEKPYNCDFCDKRFVDKQSKKIHEKRHLGKQASRIKDVYVRVNNVGSQNGNGDCGSQAQIEPTVVVVDGDEMALLTSIEAQQDKIYLA